MGIEIEYSLGYASSGDSLFRDTGLPQRSIIRLQAVINAAARLVLRVKNFDHISTLMRD